MLCASVPIGVERESTARASSSSRRPIRHCSARCQCPFHLHMMCSFLCPPCMPREAGNRANCYDLINMQINMIESSYHSYAAFFVSHLPVHSCFDPAGECAWAMPLGIGAVCCLDSRSNIWLQWSCGAICARGRPLSIWCGNLPASVAIPSR